MQNLKMVCHNLNWSFNTCLLKDWRRQGDREGDTHNLPLGSLCAAQPPILKPTFLRIGGWGDKIWNVPCANSIPGRRSSGRVAWQHTIKSVILEVKWNCMSSIGIGQSLLTQPPFFFWSTKTFRKCDWAARPQANLFATKQTSDFISLPAISAAGDKRTNSSNSGIRRQLK